MARRPTPLIDAAVDRLKANRPVVGAIVDGLRNAAADPQAAIQPAQVDAAAVEHVAAAIEAAPGVAVVETKSGWASKINWTQFASIAATLLAWVGLDLTAEQLVAVITGIQAVQSIGTIILKTWFTKTVTAASAGKP